MLILFFWALSHMLDAIGMRTKGHAHHYLYKRSKQPTHLQCVKNQSLLVQKNVEKCNKEKTMHTMKHTHTHSSTRREAMQHVDVYYSLALVEEMAFLEILLLCFFASSGSKHIL